MGDLSLYMVTHKEVSYIPHDRTPIFVGNGANTKNFLRDDTGDNIAQKNPNYCELTAYYWIWKNDRASKYISIEHYRRFFMRDLFIIPRIVDAKYIEKELKKYDVITSQEYKFYTTIKQYYENRHYIEDLLLTEEAIEKFFPAYIKTFNIVMNRNKAPLFNTVVMSKENFDLYCQWLFTILFYVEGKVDLSGRTDYQKRAFGFLAERLLEVWIEGNDLTIKRLGIYNVRSNRFRSILSSVKNRIPHTITAKYPRR